MPDEELLTQTAELLTGKIEERAKHHLAAFAISQNVPYPEAQELMLIEAAIICGITGTFEVLEHLDMIKLPDEVTNGK